jgi:hypothetical protein
MVSRIPFWILGLLGGAAIASATGLFLAVENRAEKETPTRIARCHAQGGSARLDARGVYVGCLVPPPKVAR